MSVQARPAIGTAAWYNERFENALATLLTLAEPSLKALLHDGFQPGETPPTLRDLQRMHPLEAAQVLSKLTQHPLMARNGWRLARAYKDWVTKVVTSG